MSRHQEKHPNTKNNKKSQPAPDRFGRRIVDKNNTRNVDKKKNTVEKTIGRTSLNTAKKPAVKSISAIAAEPARKIICTRTKPIELLAPAGSMECMEAAIRAGADAVYMGGPKFGARAYANNLTEEDMKWAIDYVHLHGV